jgi:hypothetical protein
MQLSTTETQSMIVCRVDSVNKRDVEVHSQMNGCRQNLAAQILNIQTNKQEAKICSRRQSVGTDPPNFCQRPVLKHNTVRNSEGQ